LVERGTCTFVEKVKNCESAGAKGVVVFNNIDNGELPLMTDDGSGETVSIPSLMIQYSDGVTLSTFVNDSSLEVEIEIE